MKVDEKGFLVQAEAPRVQRQSFAVKATELAALEKSTNRSLQALARRIRESLAENDEWWRERRHRQDQLAEFSRNRQAEIDADPAKKAEQERVREEFNKLIAPAAHAFLRKVGK